MLPIRKTVSAIKKAREVANKGGARRLVLSSPMGPATHVIIGNRLRHYYQDIVQEPVPERLTNLLKDLEGKLTSPRTH